MADNLLDKASILLTPTAYDNGSMLSIKPENGDGDFDFSRNSAATRVNAQGLVENVQIISPELVSNGDFSQIGTEEVLNGNFSQEGSEQISNGSFDTDTKWTKGTGWSISGGSANCDGTQSSNATLVQQNGVKGAIIDFVVGKTYKVNFDIVVTSGAITYIEVASGYDYDDITSSGNHTAYITAVSTNDRFTINANPDFVGSIDNVSVKEVGQNWNLLSGWSIGDNEVNFIGSAYGDSVSQNNVSTFGKTYAFDCDLTNGSFDVKIGSNSYFAYSGQTLYITADNSGASDAIIIRPLSSAVTITNISVKEVGQDWTFGTGWSMGDGKAVKTSGTGSSLFQTVPTTTIGKKYKFTFDTIVTGGVANATLYGVTIPNFSTSGSQEHTIIATSTTGFNFYGSSSFDGSIDNVSIKEITDDTDIPRIDYSGFSYQDSLGSEEIVNGDFSNGSANWIFNNSGGTFGWRIENDRAICDSNASTPNRNLNSTFSLVNGKSYKLTLDILQSEDNMQIIIGSTTLSQTLPIGTNLNYEYIITPAMHSGGVFSLYGGTSDLQEVDNISVKEYLGQEVVPDSGCGSWLLEPQSTNTVTYSEDFSQWSNISATLTSGYLAPDGTLGATKISGTIGTSNILLGSASSETATRTIWARTVSGTGTAKLMSYYQNTNNLFTLTEEWQRFELNGAIATGGLGFYVDFRDNSQTLNEFIIWGAQSEALSYATSYIPTSGATNTRLQDIATNSGNASLINSTEGVLYAEIAALTDSDANRAISLFEDNNNTISIFYLAAINTIRALILNNGSTQAQINFVLSDATDFNKIAFKYKENDCALWVNGIEVGTDVNATIPTALNSLNFDYVSNPFYGKTKALAVYKEALTDAELQSLTTI